MLEKILKPLSLVTLTISLIASIIFGGWTEANSETPGFTPPENYRKDDSIAEKFDSTKTSNEESVPKDEINMTDIFGSDQIFPFEMGLGN